MFILAIEFLALVVICYVFFVYATRKRVDENKGRLIPYKIIWVIIFILISFISIVVLESVFRKRQMGATLFRAAVDGTTEVGAAVMASTPG